jgi:hypothetical protein
MIMTAAYGLEQTTRGLSLRTYTPPIVLIFNNVTRNWPVYHDNDVPTHVTTYIDR